GECDKNGQKRILSTLEILKPAEVCTETYLVCEAFNSQKEAEAMLKYMQTRFVRFLIGLITSTQHLAKANFALVPQQTFTSKSDIDWSKSVEDIDKQLYKKYVLTKLEITFIEKMIKPM
ncbi:MAG: hypothetical protein M0P13_03210, partial [Fibrobacteraceae bacterium]|nr:hypothetical protein [Fibrobacteraceae bacterium]